jgi:hypothetical protein
MAEKTITIDTNEWAYPDKSGAKHLVTNAETFTFTLTDGGASAVTYALDGGSVNCDDGGEVQLLADAGTAGSGNIARSIGPLADANDDATTYGVEGRWLMSYNNGPIQAWVPATLKIDNVDAPTAITAKFEDQFGNSFTWTTVTVS